MLIAMTILFLLQRHREEATDEAIYTIGKYEAYPSGRRVIFNEY
jgi:hypothetical protein